MRVATASWFAVIAAALVTAASAAAQTRDGAVISARSIEGAGDWKADSKPARATQRWNLAVARGDDNTIRGRIEVADSPLLAEGNVEGKIDGRMVSGRILDDGGNPIASFTGTVGSTGMSGKYTDRTGEVGEWTWEVAMPK